MYGPIAALVSAVLFGSATPVAKVLLREITPFQLAGLLYLGGAMGVAPSAWRARAGRPPLGPAARWRLAGVVVLGGIAGPVLLLMGLRAAAASSVSLLLNLEMAATALLGTMAFGETLGPRGWAGVGGVLAAGIVVSWSSGWPGVEPALLVAAACVCWAFDNNWTALVDQMGPSETTLWKTAIAGTTNLAIGVALQPLAAPPTVVATALGVGALSYGLSILLAVAAAHHEGAVRTQSIFAIAPFVGVLLAWVGLGEPVQPGQLVAAGILVGALALLLSDRHTHAHVHEPLAHVHSHRHDDGHHRHGHPGMAASTRHTHWHEHPAEEHTHPHVADLHHRHR